MRDVGGADKADRANRRMIEDRIDHFLVAVDDLADACGKAGLQKQFSQPHWHRGSRSLGLIMKALPVAIATPLIHKGIIAGKLNGVMPAPIPIGWRIE